MLNFRFKAKWVIGNLERYTEINRDVMIEKENQLRVDRIALLVDIFALFMFYQLIKSNAMMVIDIDMQEI